MLKAKTFDLQEMAFLLNQEEALANQEEGSERDRELDRLRKGEDRDYAD